MPVIYVRVTDPFKRAAVYAFDVIEGDMICNIGGLGTKTKSISSQLRSDNTISQKLIILMALIV